MENPFKLQLRQRGKEIKSAFNWWRRLFVCWEQYFFIVRAQIASALTLPVPFVQVHFILSASARE